MDRRDVLGGVLAVVSAAMLPAAVSDRDRLRKIGRADVRQCQDALDRLYELDYVQGGRPVYELTASMARRLQDTLGRASYTPAVGRELRGVTAATCENAGWRAYDAGRYDDAHRWWLETRHIANLGPGAEEAHVIALASMSLEASERGRRGNDAVGLSRAAAEVAGESATPTLRSLLAAREAVGLAALGNARESSEAFTLAHRWLDRSKSEEDPTWLSFWGPSDLGWHEVAAARVAKRPDTAEKAARDAVKQADPINMPRNHAIYSAGLGHILASLGRYDEAIAVSREVLNNSAVSGSVRPLAALRATAGVLNRSAYPHAKAFGAAVAKVSV